MSATLESVFNTFNVLNARSVRIAYLPLYECMYIYIYIYIYIWACVQSVEKREYCEAETFVASCPESQVLLIRQALYGRMKLGRCVIHDYGYVGCQADVSTHIDAQCSGNRTCRIHIPDVELDRVNPCPKDFKTYLQVSYECITGSNDFILVCVFI